MAELNMKDEKSTGRRIRAMSWSILFIVLSAMVLPTASYLFSPDSVHAQVVNDENQRANFWRAVRSVTGKSQIVGYEGDHRTLMQRDRMEDFLSPLMMLDLSETHDAPAYA